MERQDILAIVLDLPEVSAWPEMTQVWKQALSHPRRDWELPAIAAGCVGGKVDDVLQIAAALISSQLSITLVDDILDSDPRGAHHTYGVGLISNMALAFQAVSFRLVDSLPGSAQVRAAASASLARMSLATALGQSMDVKPVQDEDAYWRVVQTKSTPFYGACLELGALVVGAKPEVVSNLRRVGELLGVIIQIFDDLADAMAQPANPDWRKGMGNLAILYAASADHSERERFLNLLKEMERSGVLEEAQRILIRSGAIAYCVYHVVQRYKEARSIVATSDLPNPGPLDNLLARQLEPVRLLLKGVGARLPLDVELSA